MTTPQELKAIISSGLLSFPLTDFDSQLRFAPEPYAQLEWLMPYGASAATAPARCGRRCRTCCPPRATRWPG